MTLLDHLNHATPARWRWDADRGAYISGAHELELTSGGRLTLYTNGRPVSEWAPALVGSSADDHWYGVAAQVARLTSAIPTTDKDEPPLFARGGDS